MLMHNPPHPGKIVKRVLLKGFGLSITEASDLLGVGRITLSNLINGKSGISPEMAVRLSIALNTSSEMWINMQAMYDLSQQGSPLRVNEITATIQATERCHEERSFVVIQVFLKEVAK